MVLCYVLSGSIPVRAATGINQQINFQGRLLNAQGATVADGFYNIEFKIYQDGDGQSVGDTTGSPTGSLKWTEDHLNNSSQGVTIKNGYFSVQLGSVTAFGSNIDWNQDTLWLSLNIGNTNASCTPFSSCSPDGEMVPMKRLSSTPYALNAGLLGGLSSAQFVQLAQGVQSDNSTNSSIFINKTNTGNLLELQASGSDAFVLNNSGDVAFGANANHSISVATAGSGVAGKSLTLTAGAAGTGGSTLAGGNLVLQGGTGGGTNGAGGNITIDAGAHNGTGADGTISIGTITASGITIGKSGITTTVNGALTGSGQVTFNRNGQSGSGDYSVGLTGTPIATSTSSLFRIGNALTGGNGSANGGTYFSIVQPASSAGSVADYLNFQNGTTTQFQVTTGGNVSVLGTYNTNTFTSSALTFGANSAATISSNGGNNITVDTSTAGSGTATFGNNASTISIGHTNTAHTVQIGDNGSTTNQQITIGSASNTNSTLALQGGNGSSAIVLQTGNNGTTAAGSIVVGNTTGAFSQTISIGTNATSGATNVVHIGDAANAVNTITIGSTSSATNAVTINAGSTGGIALGASTTLSANSNFTFGTGSGAFDAHNATGTFQTSTGTNSLNGATTVTGTNTFTVNAGTTTLNGAAAGNGNAVKITAGAATNVGLTIQGASSQTANLVQLQDTTTANVLLVDPTGDVEQLGYLDTPFGGLGAYGNLLKQSEAFDQALGNPWTYTSVTTPTANNVNAPDGNVTAESLADSSSGGSVAQTSGATSSSTLTNYTFSVWLKTSSGTQSVDLRIDASTAGTGTAATITARTTWQRFSVTQAVSTGTGFTGNIKALIFPGGVAGSGTVSAWGAQLVVGSTSGVYTNTGGSTVSATTGLVANGNAIFSPVASSTTAFQVQNASQVNYITGDATNGQLILGTASSLTGKLAFATAGGGTLTINPTSNASSFTLTLPAETGTVCTNASTSACNTSGALSNVAYLPADQTFTGKNTFSRNGSATSNDYSVGITGNPAATSSASLVHIGANLTGGNSNASGGTYLSIVQPASGAGSAADFLNLQNGSNVVQFKVDATGNLTAAGTYNTNTFTSSALTFGANSAATISSNGGNNITVDTSTAGSGIATFGNNATTTNIANSNSAHTVQIGSPASGTTNQTITIGSATNTSSTLTLQGGNGSSAIVLQTGNNGAASAGSITVGNTSGAFSQSISIGTNATSGATNVIHIGDASTAQNSVTIGSTNNATNAVAINAGSTGGITLGANTTLSANNNLTFGTGSGAFDAHNATGTFQTSTGTNSLNGATTVTGTNTFTVNGGQTTLNGATAGGASAVKITTNAATNVGLVIQGAASQSAGLLAIQDSTSANVLTVDAGGDAEHLGYLDTPFGGFGAYGNLLKQSEAFDLAGGNPWTYSPNMTAPGSANNATPRAPDGNATAEAFSSTASGSHTIAQTYSTAGNNTYTFSVWLSTNSSTQSVQLEFTSNGTPATSTPVSFTASTTWQRFSVTQTFSGSTTSVTPTIIIVANNITINAWGAQLVQASTAGVYARTTTSTVAASDGLINNGTAIFQNSANSATAYQLQNASGVNVVAIDTTNGQLVLGTASSLTGKLAFATAGGGTLTINPTSNASNFTLTLPAETGTVCTNASTSACNTSGALSNVAYLPADQTFTGKNTFSRSGTATSGDFTLGLTGTPAAASGSSLFKLGANTLTSGNSAANGGTYFAIVQPSSGAGSAADFLNFQNGSTVELQLTSGGNLTVNGTYNTNTFTSSALTFGANSAATISSNGGNNITVDTSTAGSGTATFGNNAATTNIANSNVAHTIQIGAPASGTTNQLITVGSATNTSSTLALQGGNGSSAIVLQTGNNGGATAGGIVVGNTTGAFSQTISIGTNATSGATNVVHIGDAGTAQDTITIGSTSNATNAVTINAGATNGITLGASTTLTGGSSLAFGSGNGNFDAHNATGTFQTSTGTNSLNGATTVTGTNTFTVNGGLSTLNGPSAGSSSALLVKTNAASNNGAVIQGASSQTAPLLELQDSNSSNLQVFDALGNHEQLGYFDTPFGGLGATGNLLLQSEQLATTWTATNLTVTQNDGASNPAPDGNTTADKLVSTAAGGLISQNVTGTNSTYTFSMWVKTNSATAGVQLRIDSNGTPATGTAASFTATTTWQRFSVTQTFTSGVTTITPKFIITNNTITVVGWGAQLVQASTAQVYTRTGTTAVTASDGAAVNGNAIFQAASNSSSAFLFQNASSFSILGVDASANQIKVFDGTSTQHYISLAYNDGTTTGTIAVDSGTTAIGTGTGAISILAGSGSAVTMTANATSLWRTTAGTLTLQSGTSSDLILTSGSSIVTVSGSSVVKLGQSAGDPGTCTVGAIVYNTSTNTLRGCQGSTPTWNDLINLTTPTLQQTYTASTGGTTPEIKLDTTRGALDIQGDNAGSVGTLLNIRAGTASGLGTAVFSIANTGDVTIQSSAGITELTSSNTDISIGAGNSPHSASPILLVLDNYQPVTAGAEPTEQNGAMYYDDDDNLFRCGTNGLWTNCAINNIQDSYELEDEFVGGTTTSGQIGALGWNVSTVTTTGTLSYNTTMTPTADRPGVLGIQTSTTSNTGNVVWLGGAATTGTLVVNTTNDIKASVAVGATTTNDILRVGLFSETTGTASGNDGVWIENDGTTAQWRYCYGSGAAVTCNPATVANGFSIAGPYTVQASTWISIEIKVLSSTSATFCFNGECVTKTGLSIGTTNRTNPAFACLNSTAAARNCYIDYYQISATTSAAR